VIAILVFSLLLLFVFINLVIYFFIKQTKMPKADAITALFCGSTKSLMHGSVMAKVIFGSTGIGGIILLPVLLYHALQLAATGIMARRFQSKADIDRDH